MKMVGDGGSFVRPSLPAAADAQLDLDGRGLAAVDCVLDRRIVVKLLASGADRDRFEREARAVAVLGHPNIVELFDFGRKPRWVHGLRVSRSKVTATSSLSTSARDGRQTSALRLFERLRPSRRRGRRRPLLRLSRPHPLRLRLSRPPRRPQRPQRREAPGREHSCSRPRNGQRRASSLMPARSIPPVAIFVSSLSALLSSSSVCSRRSFASSRSRSSASVRAVP
jgi:hypothetical protein